MLRYVKLESRYSESRNDGKAPRIDSQCVLGHYNKRRRSARLPAIPDPVGELSDHAAVVARIALSGLDYQLHQGSALCRSTIYLAGAPSTVTSYRAYQSSPNYRARLDYH